MFFSESYTLIYLLEEFSYSWLLNIKKEYIFRMLFWVPGLKVLHNGFERLQFKCLKNTRVLFILIVSYCNVNHVWHMLKLYTHRKKLYEYLIWASFEFKWRFPVYFTWFHVYSTLYISTRYYINSTRCWKKATL